jgi:hypothetical protein
LPKLDRCQVDLPNCWRATPRVCQILLGKSCVLPTCKNMCHVKRVHLQQFGIIHLPNLDLTYIRNPEWETKLYFYSSTSWKLKSGILRKKYFYTLSPLLMHEDVSRIVARIHARTESVFPNLG